MIEPSLNMDFFFKKITYRKIIEFRYATPCLETSISPVTWRHVHEHFNTQQYRCEDLKSVIKIYQSFYFKY